MRITPTAIALAGAMILASNAQAQTFTFMDTWNNWNNEASWNPATAGVDVIGTPKVTKIIATTSDDYKFLKKVEVVFTDMALVNFNSLFINTDFDGSAGTWDDWNYFVHSGANQFAYGSSGPVPGNGLYEVSDTYNYTLATYPTGRVGNPDGISADDLIGLGNTFAATQGLTSLVYDFTSVAGFAEGLSIGNGFYLAWSPWCANDVIGGGDPVPEPATMLLLGTGLAGLAGAARRRKK